MIHTCIITLDGRLYHLPSNSIMEITSRYGISGERWVLRYSAISDFVPIINLIPGTAPTVVALKALNHARKFREAIDSGDHFDSYFSDTKIWADVWNIAINMGKVKIPEQFDGDLAICSNVFAEKLEIIYGVLIINSHAKFKAPKLKYISGLCSDLVVSGSIVAPKLERIDGCVVIKNDINLPSLMEIGGEIIRINGAKLIAPKCNRPTNGP